MMLIITNYSILSLFFYLGLAINAIVRDPNHSEMQGFFLNLHIS